MANVDQYIDQANKNRAAIQQTGANLQGTTADQNNYYSGLQDNYRQQADSAYSDLQQTPGYTASQASAIEGNPNAAMGYYHPEQTAADASNNAADLAGKVGGYQSSLNDAAENVGNVTGQAAAGLYNGVNAAAGQTRADLTGAAGKLQSGLNSAASKAATDLQQPANAELGNLGGTYGYLKDQGEQANSEYGSSLQSATDPSKLTVDQDFKNNYALSPEQAQNIKDVAAQTTGGQFQSMRDQAGINAAAEGNTSPVALAAIQQQLGRTGAIAAGNAASAAELQANQVAADRQKDIESMSLGANQDLATRQAQNAGNLNTAKTGAATNLANLEASGTKDVAANQQSAAQLAANLGYGAASTGGQAAIDAAKTADATGYQAAQQGNQAMIDSATQGAQAKYGAAQTGGQAAIDASKTSGAQTLATDQANQQTGQTLAGNADTNASNRAGKVADTSITGQNNYRGYLTGQQGAAQQGSQTATGQGIQNASSTASGMNQATQIGSQAAQAKDNKPGLFSQIVGGATGAVSALGGGTGIMALKDGAVVGQPTDAIIGEHGPEAVIPLDQNQGYGGQMDVSGFRGDGQAVPGNQPGGANGAFGRYGQSNGQQPTDGFKSQVDQMAKSGIPNRYGGHSQTRTAGQPDQQASDPVQSMSTMSGAQPMPMEDTQPQQGMSGISGGDGGMQNQMAAQSAPQPQPPAPTPPPAQAAPQAAAAPDAPRGMASPFGQMNFGGAPQMKSGQIVTKPTRAIIGEHGPEAVVPLDGHAGSRITPGMMGNLMPKRYDATGPTALHGPMRPMKPAMSDPKMNNWKRYDSQHAGA